MIEIDNDGYNIDIHIEIWRVKEWFYKRINSISLFFGKGWYFIDCGYCRRENGKLRCGAGPSSDKPCEPKECNFFTGEDE